MNLSIPKTSKVIRPDRSAIRITLIYLLIGGLWILFSDKFAEKISNSESMLTMLSLYKGWFYVLVTGLMLYWLIHHNNSSMHKENEELQAAEENYRDIFENATVGIYRSTPDGRLLTVNPELATQFGYDSPEDFLSSVNDITQQIYKDPAKRQEFLKELNERGYIKEFINEERRKDGSIIWTSTTARVVKGNSGNVLYYEGFNVDVTERKRAENESSEARDLFQKIFTTSPIAIALSRISDRTIMALNPAMENLLGYQEAEMAGQPTVNFDYWANPQERQRAFEILLRDGTLRDYEFSFRTKSGTIGQALNYTETFEQHGDQYFLSTFVDITNRNHMEEQLRESEERFRSLYENSTMGLYRTTPDGKILLANPALVEMLGYASFEELAQRNLEEEGYEAGYERNEFQTQIEQDGEVRGLESSWRKKDGTPIFIHESAKAIRDSYGKMLYYEGTVEDITERKQAEKLLEENEKKYRLLFDNSPAGILLANTKGQILDVNSATNAILGSPSVEATRQINLLTFQPLVEAGISAYLQRAIDTGQPIHGEFSYGTKWGKAVELLAWFMPINDENRKVKQVQIILEDDTERRKAQEAVKRNAEEYQYIINSSLDGFLRLDPQGKILDVNEAYCQMLGYSHEELLNMKLPDIETLQSANGITQRMKGIREKGRGRFEVSLRHKDGRSINVEVNVVYRPSANELLSFSHDITERRKAEEALHSSEALLNMTGHTAKVGGWELDPVTGDGAWTEEVAAIHDLDPLVNPNKEMGFGFYVGDSRTLIEAAVRDAIAYGTPYDLECEIISAKGVHKWIRTICKPILENGKVVKLRGSFQDISDRVQAEEAIRENARQMQALVTSLDDIVFESDEHGTYLNVWTADESLLVRPKDELIGKRIREVMFDETATRFEKSIQSALKSGQVEEIEYLINLANRERWFLARINPIHVPDRPSKTASILVRDITKQKQAQESIRQAEHKYRNIFENATEAITQSTFDGQYLTANPAAARMLGYSSSQELISSSLDLNRQFYVKPKRREEFLSLIEKNGVVNDFESEIYRKDGEKIWITESSRAIRAENGTTLYYEGSATEITERKQAEKTLDEERNLLRTLIDIIPDRIYAKDTQGRKIISNTADWQASGGKSLEDIQGKSDFDMYPAEMASKFWTDDKLVLETGTAVLEREEPGRDRQGNPVWVLTTKIPLRDSQRQIIGLVGIGRDITGQKQAESILRESEERFRSFIEQSADGAVLIDEQEKIIEWNAAQERITGIPKVQAIGSSFAEMQFRLLPSNRRAGHSVQFFKDAMQSAFQSGTSSQFGKPFEVEIQTAAEEHKILLQTAFPIKTEKGFRLGSVIRDITESKQADAIIRQRLTELELVYESSLELGQILEPEDIAQRVLNQMDRHLNWHHSIIRLYDAESQTLKVVGSNAPGIKDKAERQELEAHFNDLIQKLGDGLTGWVAQHGQTLRIGDLKHDARYIETFPDLNSGLYVPLIANNQTVGVISIEHELPNGFSESDERLVITLANQAAIAFQNSRLQKETERQLDRLQALHSIDVAITNSLDLNVTLDVLLTQVIQQLGVDAAAIFLMQPDVGSLRFTSGQGFRTHLLEKAGSTLYMNEGIAGRAILERRPIESQAPLESQGKFKEVWEAEGLRSVYAVPLIAKGEPKGVLAVFSRSKRNAIAKDRISFLDTLAGQAAIAVENIHLFDGLQRSNMELAIAYDATIEGWSRAMDLRDEETEGHTKRVVDLTLRLAAHFDFSSEMLMHIRRGALLHDIGKLGVPDSVLLKPGKLTDEEWVLMRKHPTFAFEMLAPIQYLNRSLNIPYCHHEKWDGTGYPRGLSGEQIPLEARIFAIVDVWDALTSNRPYRKAWSKAKTLKHIRSLAGTHFDPAVVARFLELQKGNNRRQPQR